jgi:hypothetical protein
MYLSGSECKGLELRKTDHQHFPAFIREITAVPGVRGMLKVPAGWNHQQQRAEKLGAGTWNHSREPGDI